MGRKCYISFKMEDEKYKNYIQNHLDVDMIDKSQDDPINSEDPDYIMSKIREDLSDSTVTIHLIGSYSAEYSQYQDQTYIKRELQASLYNGEENTRSGILGIVLPSMYDKIYGGTGYCSTCGTSLNYININNNTTIREFNYNYYIPNSKCHWSEDDRYCVLVKWEDYIKEPEKYIELAFEKRNKPIASKVKVYPE